MWQGKAFERTFLLEAQFIYLQAPLHSLLCTISPYLPCFQAFSLVTMERAFFLFWEVGGAVGVATANSSGLTLLWEESRFF